MAKDRVNHGKLVTTLEEPMQSTVQGSRTDTGHDKIPKATRAAVRPSKGAAKGLTTQMTLCSTNLTIGYVVPEQGGYAEVNAAVLRLPIAHPNLWWNLYENTDRKVYPLWRICRRGYYLGCELDKSQSMQVSGMNTWAGSWREPSQITQS